MKTYYKLHLQAPFPLSNEAMIQEGLSPNFAERVEVYEDNNQLGTIIVSIDDNGHPDENEVANILIDTYETELGVHFGYPTEDNCGNMIEDFTSVEGGKVWEMLENCKVEM